jgi:cell division septation protein DedD
MAKPNANGSPKADYVVQIVLILFIALFSFSVGTYLGKQVSDAEYQNAAREANYGEEGQTAHGETEKSADTETIKDEEVASLTEEFLRNSRNVASENDPHKKPEAGHADPHADSTAAHTNSAEHDAHATADAQSAPEKNNTEGYVHHSKREAESKEKYNVTNEPSHDATAANTHEAPKAHQPASEHSKIDVAVEHAAARVSAGMAPAVDQAKPRLPNTTLPAVATTAVGKFTVQVASYATLAEANAFAEKLAAQGYPAFVVNADVNGKTWHRVSIGRFADQNTAKIYRSELLAKQTVTSAIVQKVIQ